MEIILAHLERIGHLNVLQRPASMIVFQIFGAILQPDSDIALVGLFADQKRVVVATQNVFARIGLIVPPLNAGETADVRKNAAELVILLPGGIEGTNSTRRDARDSAAVGISAN